MSHDQKTRDHVARRIAQGCTRREIKSCLKRYIGREIYHHLVTHPPTCST